MGFLGDLGLQVAGGVVNSLSGLFSSGQAFNRQKELMDYQMKLQDEQFKKYTSPQAQVSNLAAAGINPAVAMGNQSPVFAPSPSSGAVAPAQFGIGTTSLTDLAQYLLAKAQAKKADVETKNIDIDTEAKKFELELSKWFSAPEKVANITLAWKNVMLKDDEHNINEWKKVTEETLSQLKGIERDSAKKLFDNMDTVIQQENKQREESIKLTQEKQGTERTQQTANRASARASEASAKASESQAKLNEHQQQLIDYQAEFQDMVNKVKRSNLSSEMLTELKKILANRALSEAEQKEAQLRMQHVEAFINARNNSAAWREFDNACNWISSKISASISGSFSSVSKD